MIKDLKIRKDNRRIQSIKEIDEFCSESGINLPEILRDFFLNYEGCGMADENTYYYDHKEHLHEINQVLYLKESDKGASVEAIYKGHQYYNNLGYIPFATDSGGWDYNISIKADTLGQVWVDKFDSGEENPMHYVAPSFEEFINNLEDEREDN